MQNWNKIIYDRHHDNKPETKNYNPEGQGGLEDTRKGTNWMIAKYEAFA